MFRNDPRALGSAAIFVPMSFKNLFACSSGVYIICVLAFSCGRLISPIENACVANWGTPIVMAVCIIGRSSSNVLLSGVWSLSAIFYHPITSGMHWLRWLRNCKNVMNVYCSYRYKPYYTCTTTNIILAINGVWLGYFTSSYQFSTISCVSLFSDESSVSSQYSSRSFTRDTVTI